MVIKTNNTEYKNTHKKLPKLAKKKCDQNIESECIFMHQNPSLLLLYRSTPVTHGHFCSHEIIYASGM